MRSVLRYYYYTSGGVDPDPDIDAILGTVANPATNASTINATDTFFQMSALPVSATIKSLRLYSNNAGNVKLKLAVPVKGAGFTVTDVQTLAVVAGLNTFSVEGGTLNEIVIPPYSLLGVKAGSIGLVTFSSTTSLRGYLSATGDVSGNNVAVGTVSYGSEIQMQFTVTYKRSQEHAEFIIDEDFSGTGLPAYGVNNASSPWTFSAGKITNAGTGLANFFDFYPTTNIDRHDWSVEFDFGAAGDRFAIHKKPILAGSSVSEGTIGEADLDNNRIILYQSWNGSTTLPSVRSTLTLTNLTLATGVRYRLELLKVSRSISLRITDTTNGNTQTLTVDSTASALVGQMFGRPGMAALAGTIDVYSAQFSANVLNPEIYITGDSITEGSGTTDANAYAQLVLDAKDGVAWFSGDGGVDSTACLRRLRHELRYSTPKYAVVYIGANNANSDVQTTQLQTDIVLIRNEIINSGATPVICTLTPNSNATSNGRVQTMNAFLLSQGWTLARFDLALSLNNDGVTYDATVMFDGVHPNTAGHLLLKQRLQQDFPEMF